MKNWKKILAGIIILVLAIQFIRPAKNISETASLNNIDLRYPIPQNVQDILAKACYDCHSNNTVYPRYNNIQPVGWWLKYHVNKGKKEINFNEFLSYRVAKQYKKLGKCIEEIKEGDMPLTSYTWVHKNAILNAAEKEVLITWFDRVRDTIRGNYPADSLIIKRK